MHSDSMDSSTGEISVDSEGTVDQSGPKTLIKCEIYRTFIFIHFMVFSHRNAGF